MSSLSAHRATDRLTLAVMERIPAVSRRHLALLIHTSPMTACRAADRLIRAGILIETYGTDTVGGRRGRFLTLDPAAPLLVWLNLSHPHESVTAIVTDALLRPLCRVEHRYSELYSDEDNLRLLWGKLRRHPAAQSLNVSNTGTGIAYLPPTVPDGDFISLLRDVTRDVHPAYSIEAVSESQAVTEACLHAVPLDCERLLCVQTGNQPHAVTLRFHCDADGAVQVRAEDEKTLTATLTHYLKSEPDGAVSRFVQDYGQFHAPTPAVWVCDSERERPSAENIIFIKRKEAVIRGSLLVARRALWADMLRHPSPDQALSR